MYTLEPGFWLWLQRFRGQVTAHIDSVGQAVGFFGEKRGQLIVPMQAIRRVLIGFQPSRSHRIHFTHIWHTGSRYPIVVKTVGTGMVYSSFVTHLLRELQRLDQKPSIECGTTLFGGWSSVFVMHGIFFLLNILMGVQPRYAQKCPMGFK